MKKDEAHEKTKELFRRNSHKTTKQKLRLLELSKRFQEDICDLRKKHSNLVKEYVLNYEEMKKIYCAVITKNENKIMEKLKNFETMPLLDLMTIADPYLSEKDKENMDVFKSRMLLVVINENLMKDLVVICYRYKLYPIENWAYSIRTYILINDLLPPDFLLGAGLDGYLSRKEIMMLPQDLNFAPMVKTNRITGEKELFIKIFDDTTLKNDLKKYWHIIEKIQKIIRKEKGIKRFHTLKNLPIMEELSNNKDKIYDPVFGREIKKTDIDIALETYQNIPFNKKGEKKAGNRISQIRHRGKQLS